MIATETTRKTATTTCKKCTASFQWDYIQTGSDDLDKYNFPPDFCEKCQEILEDERDRQRQLEREAKEAEALERKIAATADRIDALTPARYRATDIAHPSFNRRLWQQVRTWRPTEEIPWLGLVGESGASKTRIAHLLLREIVLASIRSNGTESTFEITSGYEFASFVRDQHSRHMPEPRRLHDDRTVGEVARGFLDWVATTGIVLFDDMGKARNSPAASAELFAFIDRRHSQNRAMIWTSNSTPEAIVQGMSEDLAGPLAGRLIECSNIITV